MRDSALHEVLQAFTADTAAALSSERAAGADVPFEVVETDRRRGCPPLYCYRALTGEFIEQRIGLLSGLSTYAPAARALAGRDRAAAYLTMRGAAKVPDEGRELADAVLKTFLGCVFAERSDFEMDPDRFESAYEELEKALLDGRAVATVIAPLLGLSLDERTWQLELAEGLSLVRGDRFDDAPPDAAWDEAGEPRVLVVMTEAHDRSAPAPLPTACERFRRLVTALRLFEAGDFGLGPLAWWRIDFGAWRPAAVARPLPARPSTLVGARQEDELRGFCNLMARRLPALAGGSFGSPELAWAVARFELGCERSDPLQALTDHLLAMRALLEPEGPGSSRLPQRVALICARPEDRAVQAERMAEAITLERAMLIGMAAEDESAAELAQEVAEHLRALLRDALCGHLDTDLVSVAESVLAEEMAAAPA
ncbi:MAG: hypothetical protein ACJ764_06730 [Solirubrobacteraceae bacterium]